MKRWIRWTLVVVAVITLVVVLVANHAIEHILPYAPIRPHRLTAAEIVEHFAGDHTPGAARLSYEDFNITVEDTIHLRGWFIHAASPARGTIFLLHGIGNSRVGMLRRAALLVEGGLNCVLYDSRAHGESGGINCTFGYYEKHDLSAYVDSTIARFPNSAPFGVFGTSLGAAVAVQAMAIDPRLICGIVESPFATLREVIHDYFRRYYVMPLNFIPDAALKHSERIAEFHVDSVRPEHSARSITQALMIVHGTEDEHISPNYGKRIYDSTVSARKRWYPIEAGEHNNLGEVGGRAYEQAIIEWFGECCISRQMRLD